MADELDFQSDLVFVDWATHGRDSFVSPATATDFDLAESALAESVLIRESEKAVEEERVVYPVTLEPVAKADEKESLADGTFVPFDCSKGRAPDNAPIYRSRNPSARPIQEPSIEGRCTATRRRRVFVFKDGLLPRGTRKTGSLPCSSLGCKGSSSGRDARVGLASSLPEPS